jgi:Protein kinase domain
MEVGAVGALRSGDPRRLGVFELVGRLGEGGQGAVYLGHRVDEEEHYAIKLLHGELTDNATARVRFMREVELAKQVASFCTAGILEVGVEEDRPFIVTEYVNGPSLRRQVDDNGPLSGGGLQRLSIGMATALVAIHQAGVVHRDLKPANVLLGPDGPRVIDFGIAKALGGSVTVSSQVVGTPAYMAPEQLRGEPAGRPADVFAWAAVIVYAATGNPPFGQDTIPAVVHRILSVEPDLGDIDGPLGDLLARCLDKDSARRPDARGILMHLLGQDEAAAAIPEAAAALPMPEPMAVAAYPVGKTTTDADAANTMAMGAAGGSHGGEVGLMGADLAAADTTPAAGGRRPGTRRRPPAWTESWKVRGGIAAGALALVALFTSLILMNGSQAAHSTGNNNRQNVPAAVDPSSQQPAVAISNRPTSTHTSTVQHTQAPIPTNPANPSPTPTTSATIPAPPVTTPPPVKTPTPPPGGTGQSSPGT